jgi:pantoate--beta-alanine ligase
MHTVHAISELRARLAAWRAAGERIAFVPTMGNLHRGHLELVRRGRTLASRVVASVFVNPLQFGPGEDFERYPRTLAADQAALAGANCDLLFAPNAREVYPQGMENLTRVSVPGLSTILCGHFRPGHFDGVTTVVNILLNLAQPDVALFGEKDYQQLFIIRRMARDLHLPVEIVGVATEREPDGLALSSRNQYLSADERARAPALIRALRETGAALTAGRRDFVALGAAANQALGSAGFRPQYYEIRTTELAEPRHDTQEFVVLAAAYLGNTRLIDNLRVLGENPI